MKGKKDAFQEKMKIEVLYMWQWRLSTFSFFFLTEASEDLL